MATADLSQLTAIIPTSESRKSLLRLLKSLRRTYPNLRVLVADDSLETRPVKAKNVDFLKLPSGVGRGAACNAMLARVRTPQFLLLDDRCELSQESQIEQLLQLTLDDKLDLAAGDLTGCRRSFWFFVRRKPESAHGIFEIAGDHLTLRSGLRTVSDGFSWCDIVQNFYVARTDRVRAMGGWDPELKSNEREEFFVRAHRRGLRVGIDPDVSAWLWHECRQEDETRQAHNLSPLAVAKMGFSRMTDIDGQVVRAPRRIMAA